MVEVTNGKNGKRKDPVSKLSQEQIERLEEIGFKWNLPHSGSPEYFKFFNEKDPRFKS